MCTVALRIGLPGEVVLTPHHLIAARSPVQRSGQQGKIVVVLDAVHGRHERTAVGDHPAAPSALGFVKRSEFGLAVCRHDGGLFGCRWNLSAVLIDPGSQELPDDECRQSLAERGDQCRLTGGLSADDRDQTGARRLTHAMPPTARRRGWRSVSTTPAIRRRPCR